jgi:hypothetical protein
VGPCAAATDNRRGFKREKIMLLRPGSNDPLAVSGSISPDGSQEGL